MDASDPVIQRMREMAEGASARAYAPYSRFTVGAAVMVEGGELFTGCNVENGSYSLTICAERNALFQAVAAGHRRITAVVVYTPTEQPAPPCGACRQVIAEFGADAELFSFCRGAGHLRATARDLLPHAFTLDVPPEV